MNKDINLSLSVSEVDDLIRVLGSLPTSSGAWPLMMKIGGQKEAFMAINKETANAVQSE